MISNTNLPKQTFVQKVHSAHYINRILIGLMFSFALSTVFLPSFLDTKINNSRQTVVNKNVINNITNRSQVQPMIEGSVLGTVSWYDFDGVSRSSNDYYAYEKFGDFFSSPGDSGSEEAFDIDYTNLGADDNNSWGSAATTGYTSQLFKFQLNEAESDIAELEFKWNGFGDDDGMPVELLAWNYSGGGGSGEWDLIGEITFNNNDHQDIVGIKGVGEVHEYINDSTGEVTLMVRKSNN
jgi:hypothetical protein